MNSTEVQNPQCKLYAYLNWFRWLTILSVALIVDLCTLCCCCLYKVCWNVSEALMLAICDRFCSCLCKACSCACFRSSLTCFADFFSLSFFTNSSSDSKAFQHFIAFSGSPTAVHCAFLFFEAKAWPQSKLTSSCALWYYTVDIPFSDA